MDSDSLFKLILSAIVASVVGAFIKTIPNLWNRVKAIEERDIKQDGERNLTNQRVTALENQFANHTNDMKEIREKVNQIENGITSVVATINAMQHTLTQIYEQLQHSK